MNLPYNNSPNAFSAKALYQSNWIIMNREADIIYNYINDTKWTSVSIGPDPSAVVPVRKFKMSILKFKMSICQQICANASSSWLGAGYREVGGGVNWFYESMTGKVLSIIVDRPEQFLGPYHNCKQIFF